MCSVDVGIDQTLFFDQNFEIAFFVVRFEVGWPFNIPFAIGRLFCKLSVGIGISFRHTDRAEALHNKQAVIRRIKFHLVNRAARDDEVVTISEFDVTVTGFECSRAYVNKYHFIGLAVLIKIVGHGLPRRGQ